MKKLFVLLSLSILSANTFANQYDWKWIPIPQPDLNHYQQNSQNANQQIQNGLNGMIDALTGNKSNKSTNYTTTGNFTYGSDGSSYYNTGDASYGSNGYSYHQMNENTGYDSNGSNYQRVGDYIYITQPNGQKYVCYDSNVGMSCKNK